MQLELARKLVGMFIDRIVEEVFPGETGAARLQQIGLFTLVFVLDKGEGVTARQLADKTGQSLSAVYKQLAKLEAVQAVANTKKLNRQGRGQAHYFSIRPNDKTKRLIEASVKSTARQPIGRRER